MKTLWFRSLVTWRDRGIILPGLAITLLVRTSHAQAWQTVDDFQYVAGEWAVNFGLAVAPSGILFASGYAADSVGVGHGLIMASTDGGNTWSAPLDDFVYPGSATRDDGGICADAAGNLYVAGRYYFSSGPEYRFVRRSTDGGATWSTVDTVAISGFYAFPLAATQIGADSAGNVYVTVPNLNTWSIRKGVGGTSFSTVDTFQPNDSQANAVFVHPTAGVFVAGYGTVTTKKGSSQAWMVRRSLDGGAAWTTVDTYQASSGYSATAYGIGADASGNLYVVGNAGLSSNGRNSGLYWVVRKSANGGATWSTVDTYQLLIAGNQRALGFASDSLGNLYVAGEALASGGTGPIYWVVRENASGVGSWTTVDILTNSIPHAIAADGASDVFVGGQATPASGGLQWLVRKN